MKATRRKPTPRRAAATIALADVLAASSILATMHAGFDEQGYVCTGGRLHPCRDGSYTARVVWRHRDSGITVSGTARGIVLR